MTIQPTEIQKLELIAEHNLQPGTNIVLSYDQQWCFRTLNARYPATAEQAADALLQCVCELEQQLNNTQALLALRQLDGPYDKLGTSLPDIYASSG